MLRVLLAAFLASSGLASAAGEPAGKSAGDGVEELTAAEYHEGLKTLHGYLEKRGLSPEAAGRFIYVMANSLPASSDGRKVAVTRDVFSAFLRYEAAWARKTRDGKNAKVSPEQVAREAARAVVLKERFRVMAAESSPVFYRVFQAAVQDVRRARRRDGAAYAGSSAVFFGDQVDNSYSHVDAGDVALENGDAAGAIVEADKALAENPANADAFVLKAGAEYDRGEHEAAVADAQSALLLDPGNRQAKAILSLTGKDRGRAALTNAAAGGASLATDGARRGLGVLGEPVGDEHAGAVASPTPAVGALLSREFTSRAVDAADADARASIDQLDRAVSLNPGNASARSWRSAILNRIGDYSSALKSAQQSLDADPRDGAAYFQKAHALAGEKDKAGTLAALSEAARVDPSYQPLLDSAKQLPGPEDMEILFGSYARSHPPQAPPSRRGRYPTALLMLGATGGLMALAGVAQLFRRGR